MAFAMPITRPVLPTGAKAQPNGDIPLVLLGQVDGRTDPRFMLWASVAVMMRALHFAARVEAGILLRTTGRYRTLRGQWDIFAGGNARYEPCSYAQYLAAQVFRRGKTWSATTRADVAARLRVTIPNSTWWRKIKFSDGYRATAAVPGTSDHGAACADDLAEEHDGDTQVEGLRASVLQWLYANAGRFGFAWSMRSEPWHVHTIAGDTTPAEVTRYLQVVAAPELAAGARGHFVSWLQAQLNNQGHTLTVDGRFGSATLAAVLWQQGVWHQSQTGVVGPDLWWMLGKAA